MCGLAGIARFGGDAPADDGERVQAMCDAIAHRGPDEEGRSTRDGVTLGARRLAIIDVADGHQPYANESGTVRAAYNGEIYGYRALAARLGERGHALRSRADGEVIVHAWEESGERFVDELDGMFAIALHDADARRLVLVRDRLGIKPLYWAPFPGGIVFGSEIKALLASSLLERTLDTGALAELLAWEYVPAPRTLLGGVHKLEPGSLLTVDLDAGTHSVRRYWQIPGDADEGASADADAWIDRVGSCLGQAVQSQLVSDVPLGAFLSGGVDSSLVVSRMGTARTFSIGFDDPSYDETAYAERVARHLGVSHRVERLTTEADSLFDTLMPQMDDPIGDFSIFPTYLVSRLAREEVKVVLTGDGGDEIFGGYESFAADRVARPLRLVPRFVWQKLVHPLLSTLRPRPEKKGLVNSVQRFSEGLGHDPRLGHARWRLFLGPRGRERLFTPEARRAIGLDPEGHVVELARRAGNRDAVDRALFIDACSYLPENCLAKVDRMSMACSLEARVPMLDHRLVELAFRVPSRLKVRGRATKILLKRLAARELPRDCVYRPKEGFSIPIKHGLVGELRPRMDALLDARRLAADGLFEPAEVERMKREHLAGQRNHSHVLWTLMVFADWRRRWRV